MDNYYERLNQAFANWNGGEPSLEQRVEDLEAEIIQKQDILTFDTEPVEDSENPVTSGGLFSYFERYATKTALDEVYEICETKVTIQQVYGDAIQILANSDLNDYTIPGIYYALVANVSSMANTPYTATGIRLVVEKNTLSGSAVFQTLYPTSRTQLEFYRRVYEGGSWSPWCKFEGTVVT